MSDKTIRAQLLASGNLSGGRIEPKKPILRQSQAQAVAARRAEMRRKHA